MPKEKAPKPINKYDPMKDRLSHIVPFPERKKPVEPRKEFDPKNDYLEVSAFTDYKHPSKDELIATLIFASEANERSGCAAWDLNSDLQKKIEDLVGPLSHFKSKEDTDGGKSPIGEQG
jgi:hypothetical protein